MSVARRAAAPALTGGASRLAVPRLFDGAYRSVLVLTYGAGLPFYEGVLRRQLGGLRNQVILADHARLNEAVADAAAGQLRHLNRTYLAGPITSRRSAHAKAILLAGADAGMLLVGSGNLSFDGYAGGGESFTAYRWTAEDPSQLAAFQAVKDLADGLGQHGMIDPVARGRLERMWQQVDWIHQAAPEAEAGPVRHNLDTPLGEQFIAAIGDEQVTELVVMAPFHDRKADALRQLRARLRPTLTTVIVQERQTSVDPERLAAVLASGGASEVRSAVGPTPGTYLHAKIFIARTSTRAICMTGSANCSTVALFDPQPDANIEIANLHIGTPNAFDHLLAGVTLDPPRDPATLHLGFNGSADDSLVPAWRLSEVRWDPPQLSGLISPAVAESATATLVVGGQPCEDVAIVVSPQDGERSSFKATLGDDIAQQVSQVVGIALSIAMPGADAEASNVVVPYQVTALEALDSRRVDTDRLRGAAALELDDPELARMLAELEQLLVVDGRSAWRMARPDAPPDTDDGTLHFPWDQIDWVQVRRHPRYQGYATLRGLLDSTASDLAVYLGALSSSLRELTDPAQAVTPSSGGLGGDDDLGDDEGAVAESEEEEGFAEEEEQTERRRQSIQARNLRLVRNFVRRNLLAIESSEFRAGVGPGIVIPNAIVLDRLCWWVATRDEGTTGELVDERIRLWRCLWGDTVGDGGYLAEIDDDEQLATLELFAGHQTEAVLLASLHDVYQSLDYEDREFARLQCLVRVLVSHPCWQAGPDVVAVAAGLVTIRSPHVSEPVSAADLAADLYDAGAHVDVSELRAGIAAIADTEARNVRFDEVMLHVDGNPQRTKVDQLTISDPAVVLTPAIAKEMIAAWMGQEDLDHYRCRAGDRIAAYDAATEAGWWTDLDTDEEQTLDRVEPAVPVWLPALEAFTTALEVKRSA